MKENSLLKNMVMTHFTPALLFLMIAASINSMNLQFDDTMCELIENDLESPSNATRHDYLMAQEQEHIARDASRKLCGAVYDARFTQDMIPMDVLRSGLDCGAASSRAAMRINHLLDQEYAPVCRLEKDKLTPAINDLHTWHDLHRATLIAHRIALRSVENIKLTFRSDDFGNDVTYYPHIQKITGCDKDFWASLFCLSLVSQHPPAQTQSFDFKKHSIENTSIIIEYLIRVGMIQPRLLQEDEEQQVPSFDEKHSAEDFQQFSLKDSDIDLHNTGGSLESCVHGLFDLVDMVQKFHMSTKYKPRECRAPLTIAYLVGENENPLPGLPWIANLKILSFECAKEAIHKHRYEHLHWYDEVATVGTPHWKKMIFTEGPS